MSCCGAAEAADRLVWLLKARITSDVLTGDWIRVREARTDRALRAIIRDVSAPVRDEMQRLIETWQGDRFLLPDLLGDLGDRFFRVGDSLVEPFRETMIREASDIIRRTRAGVARKFAFRPSAARFGSKDNAAALFLAQTQSVFARDTHGKISRIATERAREAVTRMLEEGLGVREMRDAMIRELPGRLADPQYAYVVAANLSNRARTFGALATYQEAGIDRYEILAVLDERTTETCAMLDGKVFEVGRAMSRFDRAERGQLGDARFALPFLSERTIKGEDGGRTVIGYRTESERWRTVADVQSPRELKPDSKGEYNVKMTTESMARSGIMFPPFHHACRTTVIPVV